MYSPKCSLFRAPGCAECPERVESILRVLHLNFDADRRVCFREARAVSEEEILLFHTPEHLAKLKTYASLAKRGRHRSKGFHPDSQVVAGTYDAVLHAAGSVVHALDCMYSRTSNDYITTAFCVVRPPGHHALPGSSGGFCFLNNAGIGAMYALHSLGAKRVAVLDWDVHHGNGTESGFTPNNNLFYGSTHEVDSWPKSAKDPSPLVGQSAISPHDRRIVNRQLSAGSASKEEFRDKWRDILSEMERFRPGLVIMCAGFDAHKLDKLSRCVLEAEDFQWVTDQITMSCWRLSEVEPRSEVRYMSVLEGGYNVDANTTSAVCHVESML
ncbi:hypothetical protein B484DRAFT_339310, partial [Ochromonadaceae sp. CCMP2298]